jgi:1-phosphatidylinositol phosphodiesterase
MAISPPRRAATYLAVLLVCFIATAMLLLPFVSFSTVFGLVAGASNHNHYRGYRSAFSFDAGSGTTLGASWMADIPDATNVTSLSIPGTHDTLTYDLRDPVFQCQNVNLSTQLAAGIRYVDVRARLRGDELHVYHGNVDTGYSYSQVLVMMFEFLERHPSEAILMRLREEGAPIGTSKMTFEEVFNYYRWNSSITAEGCAKHFVMPDALASPLPTLGALRSKVLLLQDFPASAGGSTYGLAWGRAPMILEDLWDVDDVAHLALKWAAIRDALEAAASAPDDNRALFLAHLSATEGVLPIQAAAGPRNRTVTGMNDETGRYLEAGGGDGAAGKTGVVIMDFPGQRLIDAVLKRNMGLTMT